MSDRSAGAERQRRFRLRNAGDFAVDINDLSECIPVRAEGSPVIHLLFDGELLCGCLSGKPEAPIDRGRHRSCITCTAVLANSIRTGLLEEVFGNER